MPSIGDILLTAAPYAIGILATFIGFVIFGLSKQRNLMKVLGVDTDSRRVIVYLSSLFVPRWNAIGFDGQTRSYEGITIPIEELSISSPLAKALTVDAFENIPPIIRRLLQQKSSVFRPITVDTNASPMRQNDIDFSTRSIITVGSQGYNVVTNYCVSRNLCQMQITQNGSVIEIVKGKHQGEVIRRASNQHDIAILEKIVDHTRNDTGIIIAAGLDVIGTMGAVRYLIDHWQELHKTYGDKEFALALQFGPVGTMRLEEVLKGSVIRRLPEV